jgi:hypothetical protein
MRRMEMLFADVERSGFSHSLGQNVSCSGGHQDATFREAPAIIPWVLDGKF